VLGAPDPGQESPDTAVCQGSDGGRAAGSDGRAAAHRRVRYAGLCARCERMRATEKCHGTLRTLRTLRTLQHLGNVPNGRLIFGGWVVSQPPAGKQPDRHSEPVEWDVTQANRSEI
jgi:hypothetical protein